MQLVDSIRESPSKIISIDIKLFHLRSTLHNIFMELNNAGTNIR